MSDVTFVATRRNGRALCFAGFYYHINKSVEERSYWKCRTKGCKATVVTINDSISSASGQHFHDPNDSRVVLNDANDTTANGIQVERKAILYDNSLSVSNKKQKIVNNNNNEMVSNHSTKKHKSNNHNVSDNEDVDSFARHLNVEIEVDETGKVKLEDMEDYNNDNGVVAELGDSCEANAPQLMPYIKPNNVYFTNNYSNIEHFDLELYNLFKVVRQSGFNHFLDIEQLSTDWELWKRRYEELKKVKKVKSQQTIGGTEKELENLKLQLEIAINARNIADRETKRVQRSYKELQNTVSALRIVLRKNLNNGSNNQCIALLNEINELKRKVCAQVETHQANLNEVKRLLCPDDNELRSEFEQVAQERDEARREIVDLRQEIDHLRSKLSSYESST